MLHAEKLKNKPIFNWIFGFFPSFIFVLLFPFDGNHKLATLE